ncbi:hypothetical protein [Candidatus Parabeggiatoa sp. HSG14]|uniref:hypothetical protein n=1 Tax=Candidatus Parabeggiatoa sp. HSG14 TaxID=3055593 RepID=UPI0025A893E5|nr:hypothetical protein [Thiotrichales bacterium HSG14]
MPKLEYLVASFVLLISIGANAAYIEILNGPPTAFHVERDTKKIKKIAPFMPLQIGDKITVRNPPKKSQHICDKKCSITLALDGGIFKTLIYADTQEKPYIVTATDSTNVVTGVMNTFYVWFHRLWKNDIQSLVEVNTQGDNTHKIPLSMRLFKGNNAKLIARERALHLAWHGGKSPYQIQVSQKGTKKVLWDEKNIKQSEITLKKQLITAGRYQVIVNDARGKTVIGEFTAVTDIPSLFQHPETQIIEQSNLSALSKKTLLAAWLAKQGGWHFEAYQKIAMIAGYYPAQLVKQGLERGKRPTK